MALRSGLELPALDLTTGRDRDEWTEVAARVRQVAEAAGAAGFGTLWFADAPAGRDPASMWSDPCVLASACPTIGSDMHLGVVAGDGSGRHPALAARDVTALDHLSSGRAALALEYPGRSLEAATMCRGLFTQDMTTVHGEVYRIEGAVNRPPPVQVGGPVLVALVESDEVSDELSETVDAVCVGGGADAVARARAALSAGTVIWAGELPDDRDEAARAVERLVAAGAEGVICRCTDMTPLTAATVSVWADATEPLRS